MEEANWYLEQLIGIFFKCCNIILFFSRGLAKHSSNFSLSYYIFDNNSATFGTLWYFQNFLKSFVFYKFHILCWFARSNYLFHLRICELQVIVNRDLDSKKSFLQMAHPYFSQAITYRSETLN